MKKQIEEIMRDLDAIYRTDFKGDYESGLRDIAERLYDAGYRKQVEGEWIITENGCVITCSECGYRLELCYPDGTEVRSLPACPNCGTKMKDEKVTKKHFSPEEVHKMTQKEVRENLAAIMNSMRKWK